MSFAIGTVAIVGGAIALAAAGTKYGMARSGRAKRIEEQRQAKEEMDRLKQEYADLDTSNLAANVRNPYADLTNQFANLENVYEDLTVNQQQAQFEQQMAQQQQANIMQQMGAAAGGSGIAALAQTMAQQGQLQAQRASASIGMQESRIQAMTAGEAGRLQTLEAQGAAQTERLRAAGEQQAETMRLTGAEAARGLEWQKTGTMLGMEQQRLAAANEARARAKQQMISAVGDVGNIGLALMGGKKAPGGGQLNQQLPVNQQIMSGNVGVNYSSAPIHQEYGFGGRQSSQLGLGGGGFTDPSFSIDRTQYPALYNSDMIFDPTLGRMRKRFPGE